MSIFFWVKLMNYRIQLVSQGLYSFLAIFFLLEEFPCKIFILFFPLVFLALLVGSRLEIFRSKFFISDSQTFILDRAIEDIKTLLDAKVISRMKIQKVLIFGFFVSGQKKISSFCCMMHVFAFISVDFYKINDRFSIFIQKRKNVKRERITILNQEII